MADTHIDHLDVADRLRHDQARAVAETRWRACAPDRFRDAHLGHCDIHGPDVTRPVRDWVVGGSTGSLTLLGAVGTGKTYLALAVARAFITDGRRAVMFLPMVEALSSMRPDGGLSPVELSSIDLLVLDDVGTERVTEWAAEQMYAVLNRRWLSELPTVITSNLPLDELATHLGPRAWSRLTGDDSVVVRLTGPDRRRTRP